MDKFRIEWRPSCHATRIEFFESHKEMIERAREILERDDIMGMEMVCPTA